MNILADASLPGLEMAFPPPFYLTKYHHPDEINQLLPGQDVLLCRSTLKVNKDLLKAHSLRYVATASSGTDHLDSYWLNSQNIKIIDAKGSNARAVADYVVACLAVLEQRRLIQGNRAGIIGLGKVGTQVAERLQAADFQIFTFDPPKAEREKTTFHSCKLEELYQADLLCIHAELHHKQPYPSANLISNDFLKRLKPGCILINASRGGIVDENELLHSSKALIYCTDVYLNEPDINKHIVEKSIICTPHIAGHSLEAKYAAIAMISSTLHAIAKLPLPRFAAPELPPSLDLNKNEAWYESLLKIYDPIKESLSLKNALDKKNAFLNLRKQHQTRHDFCRYPIGFLANNKTRLLLGK
ncbi:4-phosphoerythronate dehydrogenase [Fluoribacter dumoffii]|uniref:Erythronate-4-phosphate dehydrogenase n=1 Tax=Fluoribacter dumoffii TaxID=463 RepID=A0A377G7U3_9GAMM|nr:4-phosphoerythronate dehydrogenase [Fluoribacter dumoffii]KTC89711.1 erythronate-4-phosphate dehydrogenase [Fluoribacter dumoffii NY 23]MCW8384905.1 4-phosphoerythronate dehydrogenase [Fluoribacter dumoffii]MCW8417967.1 4-phosphoerythronate dehydrogenase [Fluoribacter dumoffii]MCW8454191.1 4-phosphoerythronate dehydrogenase [Fluoribacter dumoffii]MCW8461735.1 4-phosphoerythronate dehydrogenase [Fluoribacter dumoffii]